MKKWKSIGAVILVALVIILCGILPKIVAEVEELFTEEATYVDIKTMQFSSELSDLEKMYLVVYGNKDDIVVESATLSQEEALAIAQERLEPYFTAGLIAREQEEFDVAICKPMFCFSNTYSQNDLSGVFWVVHLENNGQNEKEVTEQNAQEADAQFDKEMKAEITVWIDEISGEIVWIYYYNEKGCYVPEELGQKAVDFTSLFMEDKDFSSSENEIYVAEYNDAPYLYYVSYSVENVIYGNIHLEFHTTQTGFEVKYYSGNMQF